MSNSAVQTHRPLHRLLLTLVALCGVLLFVVRGYHDEREALHSRDFKQPYASARCLLRSCDPYSEAATHKAYLAAGGSDDDPVVFDPDSALYPPFSLLVLTPVAALPYPEAHAAWEALLASAFSAAVLLTADTCIAAGASLGAALLPVLLLALFTVSSTVLLMDGQISGLVIALLGIGFACLFRNRLPWLAVVCLLVAVLLKPHDAALPLLYLLFAGPRWRRVFVTVAVLALVCAGASVLWFNHAPHTVHWLTELRANLHGNAAPGAVNYPSRDNPQSINLADLEVVFAALRDQASFYTGAALACSLALLAGWLVPAIRLRNTLGKHVLCVAAIVCLTQLPIYHRQYDTRLLLLAFPAVAFLLLRPHRRRWGWAGLALLALGMILTAHQFINALLLRHSSQMEHASATRALLLYRPIPEITCVLLLFFLAALYAEMRVQSSDAAFAPES